MAYPQTATAMSGNYTTQAATPITPMQEARQVLTASVNLLTDRVGDLERRLESVLRPSQSMPSNGLDNQKLETAPSEHRQFLAVTKNEIDHTVNRLESLLNRLEL